jgi:hypothetical protein
MNKRQFEHMRRKQAERKEAKQAVVAVVVEVEPTRAEINQIILDELRYKYEQRGGPELWRRIDRLMDMGVKRKMFKIPADPKRTTVHGETLYVIAHKLKGRAMKGTGYQWYNAGYREVITGGQAMHYSMNMAVTAEEMIAWYKKVLPELPAIRARIESIEAEQTRRPYSSNTFTTGVREQYATARQKHGDFFSPISNAKIRQRSGETSPQHGGNPAVNFPKD